MFFVSVKQTLISMMSLHWKAINIYHNVENRSTSAKVVALGCLSKMTCILTDSDYILWFQISKLFLKTDEDFVFGVIYVPPSESRFNNQDELDIFVVEICNTCILYKYVCLLGDFNARTHNKDDFLDVDDFLTIILDLTTLYAIFIMFHLFCQS